ncbi:MAG: CRISPR system precrRNA processing endoribonuclease RAMP protein Cas6 [Deltaproteobacteria bacterium]|nr:CRISPR system precrRNA processing endoribonuclease RAMP protein Cas6 [Deltaproteobacteria bacterium]
MRYGTYTFICRFETDAVLPPYKGSTFRGVFGIALRNVACALKRQECVNCLLKTRCLYARVFETRLALDVPEGSRISTPPHPFVIEPPETEQMTFKPGDEAACDLLLFGEINRSLPYFVYAFEQMGRIGIGKRVNGKRAGFTLKEVRDHGRTVYGDAEHRLSLSGPGEDLVLSDPGAAAVRPTVARRGKKVGTRSRGTEAPGQGDMRVQVRLQTPLRLKYENEIRADLPFHVLVRAMLRRISSLMNAWAEGEPDLDYKGLIERAGEVRIADNHLRWFDWKRYSNRQERKMFMGGMLGSVTYEGALAEYLPLLHFCEKVHIGKNTSFGLGKIQFLTEG